jgi:hypothetical protein
MNIISKAVSPLSLVGEGVKTITKSSASNEESPSGAQCPPAVQVRLEPDMLLICDAFRLNESTRLALSEYDARTLEDFAFMTETDFQGMLVSASRLSRPLCPLQQRKVSVLLWWVHELVQDSRPFAEESEHEKSPPFLQRLFNPFADRVRKSAVLSPITSGPSKTREVHDKNVIIPPDWEKKFYRDLPLLKRKLKQEGETEHWSLVGDFFMTIRWIACGYTR